MPDLKFLSPIKRRLAAFYKAQPQRFLWIGGVLVVIVCVWCVTKSLEPEEKLFHTKNEVNFEGTRILGSSKDIYERTSKRLEGRVKAVEKTQKDLEGSVTRLNQLMEDWATKNINQDKETIPEGDNEKSDEKNTNESASILNTKPPLPSQLKTNVVPSANSSHYELSPSPRGRSRHRTGSGPAIISFPVDSKEKGEVLGVKLPPGAYVKGKVLSGVEAPEGKALPVLLQTDYAFIGPNKTRVDLTGCFMIAKSTGNLSIERVEMQATKLSCVSRSGRMFEREINGFVADDKDNSFAVMGSVNSKQDRVAAMAFLSSVVEGIGKAIQQAQTTTETGENGSSTTMISGNQKKYIAAGGASNAASMVAQWYLKQAQNLLPTINIGSGRDVWVVMQDTVSLPNWYFKSNKKAKRSGNVYSYLSRITD